MGKKTILAGLALAAAGCVSEGLAATSAAQGPRCPGPDDPVETFAFTLSKVPFSSGADFAVHLSYRYAPGLAQANFPDDNAIAKVVRDVLATYPKPDNFVEQVNRDLNAAVLAATPGIVELTSAVTKPDDGTIAEPVTSTLTSAPAPCRPTGITRSP